MSAKTCSGELVLRERKGLLTDAQRAALAAHLTLCESCRLFLEMGREFDRFKAPDTDDGARIQALSRSAERWARSGRGAPHRVAQDRRFHRRTAVLLAACMVLFGGVAAASLGRRALLGAIARRATEPPPSVRASPTPQAPPRIAPAVTGDSPNAPRPSTDPVSPPVQQPGPSAPRPSAPRRGSPPAAAQPGGAGEIFQAAGDARRRGDVPEAMALYRTLLRLYPAAPEAGLSRVTLGGLLLDAGHAKAALEQFDAAAVAPGRALRPEALYGRARALAELKQGDAEKDAWGVLLREFPTCPYAETARRRLGE